MSLLFCFNLLFVMQIFKVALCTYNFYNFFFLQKKDEDTTEKKPSENTKNKVKDKSTLNKQSDDETISNSINKKTKNKKSDDIIDNTTERKKEEL